MRLRVPSVLQEHSRIDALVRALAAQLAVKWGRSVIIDNRADAALGKHAFDPLRSFLNHAM